MDPTAADRLQRDVPPPHSSWIVLASTTRPTLSTAWGFDRSTRSFHVVLAVVVVVVAIADDDDDSVRDGDGDDDGGGRRVDRSSDSPPPIDIVRREPREGARFERRPRRRRRSTNEEDGPATTVPRRRRRRRPDDQRSVGHDAHRRGRRLRWRRRSPFEKWHHSLWSKDQFRQFGPGAAMSQASQQATAAEIMVRRDCRVAFGRRVQWATAETGIA